MPRIDIADHNAVELEPYRQLKGRTVWKQGDFFIVEGSKTVARLLESDYEVMSVLLTEPRVEEWLPRIPTTIPVYVVPHEVGVELVGFNFHVGVVACGRRRTFPRLQQHLADADQPLTLVICPKCDNPENLGAIVRNAAGFGVDAILLGPECCDPFSRRVLRVSMGTALRMTFLESRHLLRDLDWLRHTAAVELFATILDPTAERLPMVQRPRRLGLVLGNEDTGLTDEVIAACQRKVTIPMQPGVDSLNVAVASAIFLYHFAAAEPDVPAIL
jgi:tRNA G18 (ribose-2'-O)-methylase SpoU